MYNNQSLLNCLKLHPNLQVEWAFICTNVKKEQLVVVGARGDKDSCLTVMETFSRGPVHGIHVGLRQNIAGEK